MTPTPLAFGKQGGVLLQDPDTVPPVLAVKMIPHAVIDMRRPKASGKGSFLLLQALQETDFKYLWDVFYMTDRQPVPLHLSLLPMYPPYLHRQQSCSKSNSAVRTGDPPSNSLAVRCPPSRAPPSHRFLQHTGSECARLKRHGLRLCNIIY